MVKFKVVGEFITRGELYARVSWVGRTVDSADVDIATFLVGLYKNAILGSPTLFSITATDTVDLSVAGMFKMLAREIVTLVPGIIGS